MYTTILAVLLMVTVAHAQPSIRNPDLPLKTSTLDIAPVWAGHAVDFALLTSGDRQFVGFYDQKRHLTIAQRQLGDTAWTLTRLGSTVGWDSHNFIALGIDRGGFLHVAANMHVSPLVYFRSTRPGDASTLARVPAMTGQREQRCTYPVFFHDQQGRLIFDYRDGGSGNGDTLYNVYDEATRAWTPLITGPLLAGEGHRNAYPLPIVLGPDGLYHLSWLWRETAMAETNHDLGYARSADLQHWQTIEGKPITLPIRVDTPDTIVDPIPVQGGALNGEEAIGFDQSGRVVISYIKFDPQGFTQLYFARFEHGRWHRYQATHWTYRWNPHGGGSLRMELHIGPLRYEHGHMLIELEHSKYGGGTWLVNPKTLQLTRKLVTAAALADSVPESSFPGMTVRHVEDSGAPCIDGVHYRLRWETLDANRDLPRTGDLPLPSMLRLQIVP